MKSSAIKNTLRWGVIISLIIIVGISLAGSKSINAFAHDAADSFEEDTLIDLNEISDLLDWQIYLPLIIMDPLPTTPVVLNSITNEEGGNKYDVSWSQSPNATFYTLQEAQDVEFSSLATAYEGPNTEVTLTGRSVGTHYYRVRASNSKFSSDWSNVEVVVVTQELPTCPQTGSWSGTTSQGRSINFKVEDTPDCQIAAGSLSINIYYSNCYFGATTTFMQSYPITNFSFTASAVSGTFSTMTDSSGTFYHTLMHPYEPWKTCIGSGTWSATYKN